MKNSIEERILTIQLTHKQQQEYHQKVNHHSFLNQDQNNEGNIVVDDHDNGDGDIVMRNPSYHHQNDQVAMEVDLNTFTNNNTYNNTYNNTSNITTTSSSSCAGTIIGHTGNVAMNTNANANTDNTSQQQQQQQQQSQHLLTPKKSFKPLRRSISKMQDDQQLTLQDLQFILNG
jgi:hypothetical protein